jgi:hypothetical protein
MHIRGKGGFLQKEQSRKFDQRREKVEGEIKEKEKEKKILIKSMFLKNNY